MPRSCHPSPDLSLRHLPDISDTSAMPDFSEASFQIPISGPSSDLLLADESMNFFNHADDTLSTPAQPTRFRNDVPMTLAELTPRSRTGRVNPVRSSLRPRPGIPTPHRPVVAMNLAAALSEEFSPPHGRDRSFQIPAAAMRADNLLDDETCLAFGAADVTVMEAAASPEARPEPLTLSQLSPTPKPPRRTSSPLCSSVPVPSAAVRAHCDAPDSPASLTADEAPATCVIHRADAPAAAAPRASTSEAEAHTTASKAQKSPVSDNTKARLAVPSQRKELAQGEKTKRKRAVIGGGITKSKAPKPKLPRSTVVRGLSAVAKTKATGERTRPAEGVRRALGESATGPSRSAVGGAETREDHSGTAAPTAGGLAATLMSVGQRYMQQPMRSEERDMNEDQAAAAVRAAGPSSPNASALENRDTDRDRPLSFSPVSAQSAQTPAPAAQAQPVAVPAEPRCARPLSRAHPAIKRAMPAVPDASAPRHKRSRTAPAPAPSEPDSSSGQPSKARALQPSRAKNATASGVPSSVRLRQGAVDPHTNADVKSVPASSRSRTAAGDTAFRPAPPPEASSAPASAASKSASKPADPRSSRGENVPERRGAQAHIEGHAHRPRLLPTHERLAAPAPAAKATKPIEFHFQSDARAEARSKAELEKSGSDAASSLRRSRPRAPLAVPDFRTLHAAQDSLDAARREHIVPTVPLALELYTDVRAREREKFEEARRARERELELQMEERRRVRELEEEQEIKELRKRAVPKAHEIPDWYADAPKKAGKTKT